MDKDIRIAVTSYWSAFDRIACRFGLTPGDRSRLQITAPEPQETEEERAQRILFFGE